MIIYEVNLSVQPEVAKEYQSWLPEHIAHLLALPGFISASVYRRDAELPADQNRTLLTVHYSLKDRASLDAYLNEHAPRMRKAAQDLFGDKCKATRRVLEPLIS